MSEGQAPPDLANVPSFFVDQPAALQMGAHICKLVFGASDPGPGKFPRPVVTIVLPTINLLRLINDLKANLDKPEFKKMVAERYTRDAARIMTGSFQSPGETLLKLPTKKKVPKSSE